MGMYQDMFDKQIALTLSQHHDLGMGALLKRQLSAPGERAAASPRRRSNGVRQSRCHGRRPAIRRAATRRAALATQPPLNSCDSSSRCCPRSAAPRRPSASIRWGCWRRRRWRPAGASACRAPPTARRASICSASRPARSGRARGPRRHGGIQRRRGDASADRVSRVRLDRGERQRLREPAAELAALSRRARGGGMRGPTSHGIGKSGYATDPDYANKLNEILNSSTLRRRSPSRPETIAPALHRNRHAPIP
jgi:hypothetical protein